MKRDKKNKTSCAFIRARANNTLSKSTAKRPASRAASKPPARSVSQSSKAAAAAKEALEEVEDSDDELAAESSELTVLTKTSDGRSGRASSARASSVAKTPGSRRSTRGTSATGKTPGSRTVSSDVEETDGGSESDVGRRSGKSRRKTSKQTKARVSAIAEEEDDITPPKASQHVEDVDMEEPEPETEPQPEKKKRGRPPKSTGAKTAAKTKPKKEEEDEETGQEVGAEPAPPAATKKTHARTRSKANLQSDTEAAAPLTSKGTHTRTKSTSKVKVKQEEGEGEGEDEAPVAAAPAPKKKGKQRAPEVVENENEDPPSAPPAKPKGKASSRSKTKAKPEPEPEVSEEDAASAPNHSSHIRANSGRIVGQRESNSASERKSSLSEDAGYATAEAPAEADQMEVDGGPAASPPHPTKKAKAPASSVSQPVPRTNSRATPADGDIGQRPSPVVNGVRSSSAAPPSSRPPGKLSVARAPTKDSLKVIEIDSDGDGSPERPLKPQSKAKAPPSRQESTASVNGAKKPASQTSKKKLQVEVVVPRKTPQPGSSEDVRMQDDIFASPPPRPPRSPDRLTKPEPPVPGTPVSAVRRSAPPSPERDAGGDGDVHMSSNEEADTVPSASASPRTYHPFLAQFPIEKLASLTEEEMEMTLEQYVRREMELQYAQLKADGERRIEEFKQKAAETRRLIETS